MELVYLWIENYKNISNQGFNFSPQFKCEYNHKNKKWTNDENSDYISNFFGENINVTAVVGKNGSGKSSIFECIQLGIDSFFTDDAEFMLDNPNFCHYILLYRCDNQYYNLGNITLDDKKIIHGRENFYKVKELVSQNYFYYQNDKKVIEMLLDAFGRIDSNLLTFFHPDKIVLNFSNYDADILDPDIKVMFESIIKHKYEQIKKMPKMRKFDCSNKNITDCIELIKKNRRDDWFDYSEEIQSLENLKTIEKFMDSGELKSFNSIDMTLYEAIFESKISNEFKEFLLAVDDLGVLEIYDSKKQKLHPETYKNFGISFNDLSNGEKVFLNIYLSILYEIKECEEKNISKISIFLDEPENNLHPHWQKKFLLEVVNIFKKSNLEIEFFIASHSPFLLSDIPKQNIIFLDTNEDGKCKVVDGLKEKKQTFGANIHTLLSDSFFMEDGLMGEFAKSKIDKTIKLLNQEKLSQDDLKYCEQIISIVGEPIIKNQLQQMLNSKRLKKIDEIDAIKETIDNLQQRLDKLEK